MTKGRRMTRLALALASLVLVAATGHFTVARVEAQQGPPTHQSILDSLDAVQSKLDQIPPAWSQILPAADRFQLVLGGAGVLDSETGLVWEQSPDATGQTWSSAQTFCNTRNVGGRLGWRVPTLQELASLVDPTHTDFQSPTLPAGHPFSNVRRGVYWSATTHAGNTIEAWEVNFLLGFGPGFGEKTFPGFVWCVRGGQGVDPQ